MAPHVMSPPVQVAFPNPLSNILDLRGPIPRIDSPMEKDNPMGQALSDAVTDSRRPVTKRALSATPSSEADEASQDSADIRFVLVRNPNDLKDRGEMRKNRSFVMNGFLKRERLNPNSNDPRVRGRNSGRQKKSDQVTSSLLPGGPTSRALPKTTSVEHAQLSNDSQTQKGSRALTQNTPGAAPRSSEADPPLDQRPPMRLRTDITSAAASQRTSPLIPGFPNSFPRVGYLSTPFSQVPFYPRQICQVDGELNPFHSWPDFDDPNMDIADLKWRCGLRFGSRGLALNWVPALLQARHAFLSTICISAAHDDIMSRAFIKPHSRTPSYERVHVRLEVISMINESLDDPDLRLADSTIIAVLQLLNSEIMGCNDDVMRVHQKGLQDMVVQRGGLDKLGVRGHLAQVVTITMYIMAVLRELTPGRDFINYAARQNTKMEEGNSPLPESPVYCRPSGFSTINRALRPDSATHRLLDTLRIMTNKFFDRHAHQTQTSQTPFRQAKFFDQSSDSLLALRAQIFAFPAGRDVDEFIRVGDRYVYESIRLTALAYSHALATNLPFSVAAAQLHSKHTTTACENGGSDSAYDCENVTAPLPIRIRNAMMQTDLSGLWNHLAGTLFWISLVGGAMANPGPLGQHDRVGEDEDARKWLAATAVRCSIVMSFDFGASVLETLKRLAGIENVLAMEVLEESGTELPTIPITNASGMPIFGPPEPMESFADFALDFQDA